MVGGNNPRPHTYYLRSCKRKRLTDIESLPDELLFEILVRVPAYDIYNPTRLVCRKWYHMIHTCIFVSAHLQRSTYWLLFQSLFEDPFFMSVGESGRVEISKDRYNKLEFPVKTSCNGLLLESQDYDNKNLYVSNPATRQIFTFPPITGYTLIYEIFAIAYAASSMEYKAVVIFCPGRGIQKTCFILTIGVDNSWRTIGKECASLATTLILNSTPIITEGFAHWCYSSTPGHQVLTLNVETEIITDTTGPAPKGNLRNTYLSTGRYLTLLRQCGKICWEVWEMKPKIDYQWRKVSDISLEANKCSIFQQPRFLKSEICIPIGWLKYLEMLVFRPSYTIQSQIFVYNLLTSEFVTIELPTPNCDYRPVVHKESLVSLRGC